MMRLWWPGVAGLMALFGLCLGGFLLLPASPPPMIDLEGLFPITSQCPTGCMLGIPPENTPLPDGVRMLQAHEWVGGVYGGWQDEVFHADVTVRWRWSGAQPDYIDSTVPGIMLAHSYGGDGGHVIVGMMIATRSRIYDLQQILGPASDGLAVYDPAHQVVNYTVSYYDPASLTRTSLVTALPCPVRLMTYWQALATLDFRSGHMLTPYVAPKSLSGLCR